jgi:hypothetical protein
LADFVSLPGGSFCWWPMYHVGDCGLDCSWNPTSKLRSFTAAHGTSSAVPLALPWRTLEQGESSEGELASV